MRKELPEIIQATASYEQWLGRLTPLNKQDLAAKHEAMASAAFPFLRATFYRWTQLWPRVCPELAQAPRVLAVGDLHVENFGTWRDAEGRLAWGVNDFDEVFPLAYTNDLVRLATSTLLAVEGHHLSVDGKEACDAILGGYRQHMDSGGRPFVIDEDHHWFVSLLLSKTKASDPSLFWGHLREVAQSQARKGVPPAAKAVLNRQLPAGSTEIQMLPRRAGVGSLGRPRFVAMGQWQGGPVAREIKALAPSACVWSADAALPKGTRPATTRGVSSRISELLEQLTRRRLRCRDPFFHLTDQWIVRRLACDSRKIELKVSPREPDELRLLEAMGRETANVHLATTAAVARVRKDLACRGNKWLRAAAEAMQKATMEDQKAWARHG